MANVHLHIPSFNAGELSPLLGARFAVEKVQSGCRRLRNFIPHVHGPAFRRPGMEDMGASMGQAAKSNLRGFNFSTTTGFILELHPDGLQVWSNGLLVDLENPVALPYSESECAEVQMSQVNDVCYLTHGNHRPRKLIRYRDDKWALEEIEWDWPALGDENVREEEITTADVTELLTVPTYDWVEFPAAGSITMVLSVVNPDTSAAVKIARLQRLSGGSWVTSASLTWTTVAPSTDSYAAGLANTWRLTYDGPATATGEVVANWDEGVVPFERQLFLDDPLPLSEEEVLVPIGDWQAVVTSAATVPAGATLHVQKKVGATWVNVKNLTLTAGATTIYRGVKLTVATTMRFQWAGRMMFDGEASIEQLEFTPSVATTLAISAPSGEGRTLTASEPLFQAGHVGSYWQVTHRRDSASSIITEEDGTISASSSTEIRVSGQWDVSTYGIWTTTLYLERYVGGAWETVRSWAGRNDRNVIASGTEEEPVMMRLRVAAGTAIEAGTTVDADANYWPRFVLEAADARVNGLVVVTAVGTLNDDGKSTTATVDVLSDLYATSATPLWTEGAWSGVNGYPRTVAQHGGRLWFGGTGKEPMRTWGSVVNDYENFRRSSLDDASVSFTPAAQQANSLQWMASHGVDLVLGTNGDEWTLSGGVDNGPITPVSVQMQRRSGYGSSYRQSIILGEVLAFVQRGGRKLRSVAPRETGGIWSANDLTVLAEHVTLTGIEQIAAMNFPSTIIWAVTGDGKLIGMTFEQEQNVFAWHVHETDGLVESVAVVFGTESDQVWLAVNRDGSRRIERLDPEVFARVFTAPERLIYLDSAKRLELGFRVDSTISARVDGASYWTHKYFPAAGLTGAGIAEGDVVYDEEGRSGVAFDPPIDEGGGVFSFRTVKGDAFLPSLTGDGAIYAGRTAILTGLEHLEGREVQILGDGAHLQPRLVVGGAVTAEKVVSVAVVGLSYTSELQPMRMDIPLRDGTAQFRKFQVRRVGLYFHESLGGEVAADPDGRFEKINMRRASTPMDSAPPLQTGESETAVESTVGYGYDVIVRQTAPLPLNVGSITIFGDIHGD